MFKNKKNNIVIIAGSGRSGTTWLGSILSASPRVDYYYEIDMIKGLDFDQKKVKRIKYPLTFWLRKKPAFALKLEEKILAKCLKHGFKKREIEKTFRIRNRMMLSSSEFDIDVYKIVKILWFVLRLDELKARFSGRLKIIHIIRNPYSQIASEIRQHENNKDKMQDFFSQRLEYITTQDSLSGYHALARKYFHGSWIEKMVVIWWIANEFILDKKLSYVHSVVYEDLCRNTNSEIEKIFSFLRWPITPEVESHLALTSGITVNDDNEWSIRKNAEIAIGRWRNDLSEKDFDTITEVLAFCQLMKLWGSDDLVYKKIS